METFLFHSFILSFMLCVACFLEWYAKKTDAKTAFEVALLCVVPGANLVATCFLIHYYVENYLNELDRKG